MEELHIGLFSINIVFGGFIDINILHICSRSLFGIYVERGFLSINILFLEFRRYGKVI